MPINSAKAAGMNALLSAAKALNQRLLLQEVKTLLFNRNDSRELCSREKALKKKARRTFKERWN